jgi:arylsulfatase A-like enzyme
MRLWRETVVPSVGSSAAVLVASTAWSLLSARATYDGVQDESVSAAAQERYHPYLVRVGVALAGVALTELLLFSVTLVGLSLLWRFSRLSSSGLLATRRVWLLHVVAAAVLAATYFGFVADRHPGLFLSTLSGASLAYPMLAVARWFAPAVALGSFAGYVLGVVRGPTRLRVAVSVLVLVVTAGTVAERQLGRRFVHRAYRAGPDERPTRANATAKRRRASKPSVLWLGVDSLRPDKIDPAATPNISRLLAESVYFPNTLVAVPRTGPSWVAALTSTAPLTNGVETMFPDAVAGRLSYVGLPGHLAARKYRTAVFSDYAGEFFGRVDLGFQTKSVPDVELREISGQLLVASAPLVFAQVGTIYSMGPFERMLLGEPLTTLVRGLTSFTQPNALADDLASWLHVDRATPFFSLAFYSQPHFPYASNGPWYRKYHASGSSSSLAFGRDVANETPITSSEDRRQIDGLYRGALAESDAAIGDLLARLEASGDLADTIVILTADHGEGLYECASCVGHGDNLKSMYTLRTPLAIRLPQGRFPKSAPRVVDTYVSQLDIYPTILALIGEPPIAIHEGLALLDGAGSDVPPPPRRVLFSETGEWLWTTAAVPKDRLDYPPITGMAILEHGRIVIDRKYYPVIRSAKHRAAVRWPYKLTYEPQKSGVVYHLYKADEDPLEEHDITASQPKIAEELKRELMLDVVRHPDIMSVRDFIVSRPTPEEE